MTRGRYQGIGLLVTVGWLVALPPAVAGPYDLREQTPEVTQALAGRQGRYQTLQDQKTAGVIGETNAGLVEALGGGEEVLALTEAENADRLVLYRAIVEQNGLPTDALRTVQEVFADVQRAKASPGHRLQLPTGEWTTKAPGP